MMTVLASLYDVFLGKCYLWILILGTPWIPSLPQPPFSLHATLRKISSVITRHTPLIARVCSTERANRADWEWSWSRTCIKVLRYFSYACTRCPNLTDTAPFLTLIRTRSYRGSVSMRFSKVLYSVSLIRHARSRPSVPEALQSAFIYGTPHCSRH